MSSDVRFSLLILSKLLKSAQILLRSWSEIWHAARHLFWCSSCQGHCNEFRCCQSRWNERIKDVTRCHQAPTVENFKNNVWSLNFVSQRLFFITTPNFLSASLYLLWFGCKMCGSVWRWMHGENSF
jgi:hypothetical protein